MLTSVHAFGYSLGIYRTDVLIVVNMWLTLLLDLFLMGSAAAIIASMVVEYRTHQLPHVGLARAPRAVRRSDPFQARTRRPAVGSGRRRLAA